VKRREVIRHLEKNGCEFLREGANHTIYINRAKRKASSVPRHKEINDSLSSRSVVTWRSQIRKQRNEALQIDERRLRVWFKGG